MNDPLDKDQNLEKIQTNILNELKLDQAIRLAKKYVKDGLGEEAKRIYQDILAKFPKNKNAINGMKTLSSYSIKKNPTEQNPSADQLETLVSLYTQGNLQVALKETSNLLEKFPNSVILYNIKGVVNAGLGQPAAAVVSYKKAISINPKNADAYYNMGVTLQGQGKLEEAIESYDNVTSINPDYVKAYHNKGNLLKEQGMLSAAVTIYKKALAIEPNNSDIYCNIGASLQEQGKLEESIEAFNKAISINPEYAEAYYNMGISLQKLREMEEAIKKYQKAISIKTDYAEAYGNMGNLLKDQGKSDEAIEVYQKAILINPDYFTAYYNLGIILCEQEMFDDGIDAFNKAILIKPDYAEAFNNLGVALQDKGNLKDAEAAYNKAISIKPDYAEAYNNMGVALIAQEQLEDGLAAYDKAISLLPNFTEAYSNKGNALIEQGKLSDAIGVYEHALTLDPSCHAAVEDFLTLQSQLNYSTLMQTSTPYQLYEANCKIGKKPKFYVLHAIHAFLEANINLTQKYIQNFNQCDQKLLNMLKPRDRVFCTAFTNFLNKLIESPFNNPDKYVSNNFIYHLGESHCLSYAHRIINMNSIPYHVVPKIVYGAKAYHFSKKRHNSYKTIMKVHIASIPKNSEVFISVGEIDCRPDEGFVVAAKKRNKPIEELISITVKEHLKWFSEHNKDQNHNIHFLNLPAPVYDKNLDKVINADVANTVALFNMFLAQHIVLHDFNLIDVYKFTVGKNGFSNNFFHIDNRHLSPKIITEIETQIKYI
tara:strand:- start:208 stop:2505 length:2298 start_codon:yes stop_codon:yes gene_type:complete